MGIQLEMHGRSSGFGNQCGHSGWEFVEDLMVCIQEHFTVGTRDGTSRLTLRVGFLAGNSERESRLAMQGWMWEKNFW